MPDPLQAKCCTTSRSRVSAAAPIPVPTPVNRTASQKRTASGDWNVEGMRFPAAGGEGTSGVVSFMGVSPEWYRALTASLSCDHCGTSRLTFSNVTWDQKLLPSRAGRAVLMGGRYLLMSATKYSIPSLPPRAKQEPHTLDNSSALITSTAGSRACRVLNGPTYQAGATALRS